MKGTLWKKIDVAVPKKIERGDPLVSSGIVYYAENLLGSVPWPNRYNLASKNTDEKP